MKRVVVGGYFDPLHEGHIELFKYAKKFGRVIVVTHPCEHSLFKSKFYVWDTETKVKVIKSIRYVEDVVLSIDKDNTINETLRMIKPRYYVVGKEYKQNILPEAVTLSEIGCTIVYCPYRKVNNSSSIKSNILKQLGVSE